MRWICLTIVACDRATKTSTEDFPSPEWAAFQPPPQGWDSTLTKAVYYDKVLGALVGAAIGDAMGAPTEMWHRERIRPQWGYVDTFTEVIRNTDPEGTWEDNLPAAGTTDDTRWKILAGRYLCSAATSCDSLNARAFAQSITDIYLREQKNARSIETFDPEPLEHELMHAAWLQERAKVAKPYLDNNLDAYAIAVGKFYGGEITCGGMLYAPVLGAFFPANPEKAYLEAFRLGFFDIGYARDVTGLTAAMVAQAMRPGIAYEQITHVCRTVDPMRYSNSRLLGRRSMWHFMDAKSIAYEAKQIQKADPKIPPIFRKTKRVSKDQTISLGNQVYYLSQAPILKKAEIKFRKTGQCFLITINDKICFKTPIKGMTKQDLIGDVSLPLLGVQLKFFH